VASLLAMAGSARAEYFSNLDGFDAAGQPRVQVELSPYAWNPGVSGTVGFAAPHVGDRNFNSGIPSAQELSNILRGAFMGSALVRYGNWSGEVDIVWIDVSQSKDVFRDAFGNLARARASASTVRVAPGFGYRVYDDTVLGIAVSVDARAGFAYLGMSQSIDGEGLLVGRGFSGNNDALQPWVGFRAAFIPSERWRIELDGIVQGFEVNGGWGGGVALYGSYALDELISLSAGFRVLNSYFEGSRDTFNGTRRSLDMTAYGPMLGVSFRF
jgi:hypothetical protein